MNRFVRKTGAPGRLLVGKDRRLVGFEFLGGLIEHNAMALVDRISGAVEVSQFDKVKNCIYDSFDAEYECAGQKDYCNYNQDFHLV